MAANIEKLTVKDTFTNWRDKINAIADVAILAPMADEDGIMKIDVLNCNAKEVQIGVPVRMLSDIDVKQIDNYGSYTSSITTQTVAGTADAALKLTSTEDYNPWASGRTANGTMTMWTSMFDDDLHFTHVNLAGEVVNTLSWDPETNTISAAVGISEEARSAWTADTLQVENLSSSAIPESCPVVFGRVDGDEASGAWDEAMTYNPRTDTLTVPVVKGDLDGNAKTATSAGKLSAARRISLGTDAEGYADFDGSQDITIPCLLKDTGVIGGPYGPSSNVTVPRTNRKFTVPYFRVDSKGRIVEAYTRTITFPYPEVDVDSELSGSSQNPIQNRAVAEKFSEIDAVLETVPTNGTATTESDGLMSAADKAKLNSLQQWPRIKTVTAVVKNASGAIAGTSSKNLSASAASTLSVTASGGLSAAVTQSGTAAAPVVDVALSVNASDVAGSGISAVDGKLTVPVYAGCTASAAGTAGTVPPAAAGQGGLFLNGAGQWAEPEKTVYGNATASAAGLMSAADKSKLDGIQAQASKVAVTRVLNSGTKIATLNVNGTNTDLYCVTPDTPDYGVFTAATSSAAGTNGLVPGPAKGVQNKYLRSDASWQTVYDSGEIDSKLALKANIDSPAFAGIPTVPPAAAGTSSTQAANTAFVTTAISNLKGGVTESLGTLKAIAASIGNNTNFKKYVDDGLAAKLSTNSANYIKTLTLDGKTLSGTKGDGTPFSFTTVDTNTTYSNFIKSGSGAKAGLVPAPSTTAGSTKYLCENGTWAVPANTDEKVKNTLAATTKAYITGTTSASTNTGAQVFDTGVFLTTTAGVLQATTFKGALDGNAKTATTLQTARTINGVSFNGSKNITVADSTKLPLAGGTMTGNLVIKKSAPYIYLQNTSMTKGSKPSSNQYTLIALTSSAGNASGNRIGLVQSSLNTSGNVTTGIYAYKNTKDATTNASVSVTYEAGGTAYANCPTPPEGDNSTKIATTAWVNKKTNSSGTSMVPKWSSRANRSKNTSYTAETNGFAMIYGRCNDGQEPKITINDQTYDNSFWSYTGHQHKYLVYPIAKGDTYKMNQAGYWIPAK